MKNILCKSWRILSTEAEGRALRDSDRAAAKETSEASSASLPVFTLSTNLLRRSRDNTHLTQREIVSNSRDLVLRE